MTNPVSKIEAVLSNKRCMTEVTLLSDGKKLPRHYELVSTLVSRELNRIPMARLIFIDGDPAKQDFKLSNAEDIQPGKEFEVLAGSPHDQVSIFKGVIISHGIKVKESGTALLTIDCKDVAVKLSVGRKSRYFYNNFDSDIIDDVATKGGLNTQITKTTIKYKEVVQYQATDWDFILSRAEVNGQLVLIEDGLLRTVIPDMATQETATFQYGRDILAFDAAYDARTQYKTVKGISWDISNQEIQQEEGEYTGDTQQGDLDAETLAKVINLESFDLRHTGALKNQELKQWADAKMLKSRLARIRGKVKVVGVPGVMPGHTIRLEGVGDRFNGKAFVSGVRHEIAGGVWNMDIQFGLAEEWLSQKLNMSEQSAAGLLPAIQGLQIGVVSKLEDDPEKEYRIQVRLPIIDPGEEGVWARIALIDAGKNRSAFFMPEIGDEVLVGFLNDDPRHPVVLGMLHSSAKPAPVKASDDNHEKGFVTRGDLRVLFNDDEKSISISTPKGNQLIISEKEGSIVLSDENNNAITLDSSGIKIESAGDIVLSAKKKVDIDASEFKASAKTFKAKSNGMMELSGGATTIKGNPVHLNP